MGGFTLVELMIVVVILGILAAVAIPAFSRYTKKSRTAEAVTNVSAICQGQRTYFEASRQRSSGSAQFVATTETPGTPTRNKFLPSTAWQTPEWQAIGFSIADPHYYSYQTTLSGATAFTALARGDLDGDGIFANFSRTGTLDSQNEVTLSSLTITNELE